MSVHWGSNFRGSSAKRSWTASGNDSPDYSPVYYRDSECNARLFILSSINVDLSQAFTRFSILKDLSIVTVE